MNTQIIKILKKESRKTIRITSFCTRQDNEVMMFFNLFINSKVSLLVTRMFSNKFSNPTRRCFKLTRSLPFYQIQVLLNGTMSISINFHAKQIGINQWYQSWKFAFLQKRKTFRTILI